jgi:hypothetical protein
MLLKRHLISLVKLVGPRNGVLNHMFHVVRLVSAANFQVNSGKDDIMPPKMLSASMILLSIYHLRTYQHDISLCILCSTDTSDRRFVRCLTCGVDDTDTFSYIRFNFLQLFSSMCQCSVWYLCECFIVMYNSQYLKIHM